MKRLVLFVCTLSFCLSVEAQNRTSIRPRKKLETPTQSAPSQPRVKEDSLPTPDTYREPVYPISTHVVDRSITDFSYIPSQWEVTTSFRYKYLTSKFQVKDSLSVVRIDTKSTRNTLGADAQLGLTDWLAVAVEWSYENEQSENNSTTKAMGMTDPTFGVVARVLDQYKNGFADVNVGLTYSPSVIDAKDASSLQEGNSGRGGDLLGAIASLNKKISDLEFKLSLIYGSAGKATKKMAGATSTTDSKKVLGLQTGLQYQASSRIYGYGNLGYSSVSDYTINVSTGEYVKYDPASMFWADVGTKIVLLENVNYLQLEARFDMEREQTMEATSLGKGSIKTDPSLTFMMGYTHRF